MMCQQLLTPHAMMLSAWTTQMGVTPFPPSAFVLAAKAPMNLLLDVRATNEDPLRLD